MLASTNLECCDRSPEIVSIAEIYQERIVAALSARVGRSSDRRDSALWRWNEIRLTARTQCPERTEGYPHTESRIGFWGRLLGMLCPPMGPRSRHQQAANGL